MMSNCSLMAVTAGSSGRRCSVSTPFSAFGQRGEAADILARPMRTAIKATASTSTTPAANTTLRRISTCALLTLDRTRR